MSNCKGKNGAYARKIAKLAASITSRTKIEDVDIAKLFSVVNVQETRLVVGECSCCKECVFVTIDGEFRSPFGECFKSHLLYDCPTIQRMYEQYLDLDYKPQM